jgi:hypothetical protein
MPPAPVSSGTRLIAINFGSRGGELDSTVAKANEIIKDLETIDASAGLTEACYSCRADRFGRCGRRSLVDL